MYIESESIKNILLYKAIHIILTIFSLACLSIKLSLIKCLITFAVIGSWCIETILRTHIRRLYTLIVILTCFTILCQFITLRTLTIKASQSINTLMFTLICFHFGTFINMAMGWFIRAIIAINLLVAHLFIRNALTPTLASELGTRTCWCFCCTVFLEFITSITTIILPITMVDFSDAFGISAGKFITATSSES